MLKSFFMARPDTTEIDVELERTMRVIHDRIEKMLATKRQTYSSFASSQNRSTMIN